MANDREGSRGDERRKRQDALRALADGAQAQVETAKDAGAPALAAVAAKLRPDGTRLAAVAGNPDNSEEVYVLDCASGTILAKINLSGKANANGNIQTGSGIMWSPDEKWLLVGSQAELFILGPGKLPQ